MYAAFFLEKFARDAQQEKGPSSEAIAATTVAGASPFAGLIGQKKVIHDPYLNPKGTQFKTMKDLGAAAQPGDILMTSNDGRSMWKSFIAPQSGGEIFHTQPVVGRRRGMGTTVTAGENAGASLGEIKRDKAYYVDDVPKAMRAGGYTDATLLRPKKPLTTAERKKFVDKVLERSGKKYDNNKALTTWLKDMFIPKIKGVTGRGKQVRCEGNVCSTMPAQALHEATGGKRQVVPGKRAQDIFPTDFSRSEAYETVGSRTPSKYTKSLLRRRLTPYLSRGALGVGLAGGTYAVSQDPAVAGSAAGVGAGALLSGKLIKKNPTAIGVLEEAMAGGEAGGKWNKWGRLKRWSGVKAPLVAAGGALGYLGARKAMKAFRGKEEGGAPSRADV
jgi:hypothetical protein